MSRLFVSVRCVAGALVFLLSDGCGPGPQTTPDSVRPTRQKELQAVRVPGRGILKGRASLDGQRPDLAARNARLREVVNCHPDNADCLQGGKEGVEDQVWRVSEQGGVANVVVWLRPPEGFYFNMEPADLDPDQAGWKREMVIDSPRCVFLPHVAVLFPSYYDPHGQKKPTPTGQVFKVTNSGEIHHDVSLKGGSAKKFQSFGRTIPPNPKAVLTPSILPDPEPVVVGCDIHKWMGAYVWAFDHPYAAVTDDEGNYEIKNAPAGVEVRVVAWHEAAGWLTAGGDKGDPIEIAVGGSREQFFKVKGTE